MQVFPGDDFTADDIRSMMDELIAAGLVLQYFAEGKEYWHVTGWHHQKIEKKAYKYPQPSQFVDQSSTSRRPVVDNSPPEVDVDRKGEKSSVKRASAPTAAPAKQEKPEACLERITRQPVTMSPDWKPGEQFKALMMRAGVRPDTLTDEMLAKFQIHYNGESKPQNKWESALVAWCRRERYPSTTEQQSAPKNGLPGGHIENAPMLREYQPPVMPERTPETAANAKKYMGRVREVLG